MTLGKLKRLSKKSLQRKGRAYHSKKKERKEERKKTSIEKVNIFYLRFVTVDGATYNYFCVYVLLRLCTLCDPK